MPLTLSYLPSINKFINYNGVIVHDLYHVFDVWQLDKWKKQQQTSLVHDRNGNEWLIEYLSDEEEDDIFDLMNWNESFGVSMERDYYY